jgi:hypothetical protein
MRMTSHRMNRGRAVMCGVRPTVVHRHIDCQTTVHGTRVQLHRLRQTDGKPHRQDAGEATEDRIMPHATNIGC